jgi:hypothetical protein
VRIIRNPKIQNAALVIVKSGGTKSYHWILTSYHKRELRNAQLSDRPHTKRNAVNQSVLTPAFSSLPEIQDAAAEWQGVCPSFLCACSPVHLGSACMCVHTAHSDRAANVYELKRITSISLNNTYTIMSFIVCKGKAVPQHSYGGAGGSGYIDPAHSRPLQ